MAMLHDESQRKMDAEVAAHGHCPECLQDLTKVDPENHLATEFPRWQEPGMEFSDYGRRARLIRQYIDGLAAKPAAEAGH